MRTNRRWKRAIAGTVSLLLLAAVPILAIAVLGPSAFSQPDLRDDLSLGGMSVSFLPESSEPADKAVDQRISTGSDGEQVVTYLKNWEYTYRSTTRTR